jgi:hypothetical protein
MDAYSGYNQIPMHPDDQEKTAFITDIGIYCYNIMSFGFKNVGATYQRMMTKVFEKQIDRILEICIDDMIVKTLEDKELVPNFQETFTQLRRYDVRLNPNKCTFGVEAGKFLGFILTNCRIEINPNKCSAILNMQRTRAIKEIQQLTGRIVALTRFLSASARRCLPFFKMLRNKETFNWDSECEKSFPKLKAIFASPPMLSRPDPGQTMYLYLVVADEAVSAAVGKEES